MYPISRLQEDLAERLKGADPSSWLDGVAFALAELALELKESGEDDAAWNVGVAARGVRRAADRKRRERSH